MSFDIDDAFDRLIEVIEMRATDAERSRLSYETRLSDLTRTRDELQSTARHEKNMRELSDAQLATLKQKVVSVTEEWNKLVMSEATGSMPVSLILAMKALDDSTPF